MISSNHIKHDGIIFCPECGSKMHKMGKVWSGRKQVQRYRCPKCGRTYVPSNQEEEQPEKPE